MKEHLLLMAGNLEGHLEPLEERCHIHRCYDDAGSSRVLLSEFGERIRVVGTNGHIGCSAQMMEQLPRLEMIGCFGVGIDAIDVGVAKKRGISVTNTPEVLNDAVAELALGLMIALSRRIPQSDRYVRSGYWESGEMPLTCELSGRTAGIVGLGRIGKELAVRLQCMKMRVVYHGRNRQPNLPFEYFAELEEMAAAVDWLVVCLPGGEQTDRLISGTVLDALGPQGCLVNVARGSVVDEEALCRHVAEQSIGGAALDVFAAEPCVPEVLRDAQNVILSPHAASATGKARHDMGELVVRNITAYLDGRPLLTRVI